ncbi:hypothetical protein JJB07_05330 [Tumebacillus sp. ITR2]|uniref:Dockerin domain-containing protein n=1 Tax=Tumebacillus amylolyticus TaxID=2801339 RepID=A0ABS1J789_9BACL|nr:cohesin domain-containing protein [Tumebacillus amylolyticus]MBL0386070.1 hypothetical protein [Tumebacillus amylolyticus]
MSIYKRQHRTLLGIVALVFMLMVNMVLLPAGVASAAEVQKNVVTKVVAGDSFGAVIKSDGTVWTWGLNYFGNLGDGTTRNHNTPVQVSGLTDVSAVASGNGYTLALKSDGTVWTWGWNTYGQLGDGTTETRLTPVKVLRLKDVVAISSGWDTSFALKSDGTVWAWGSNNYGQLGIGTQSNLANPVPVQVVGLDHVTSIDSGFNFSLAVKSDGTVWAWGSNSIGQLGDGTKTDRNAPVQVAELTNVISVSAGAAHSLALKSDRTVWAWGGSESDQGEYGSTSVQVQGLEGVTAIEAGLGRFMCIKSDGTVWKWGSPDQGHGYNWIPTRAYEAPVDTTAFSASEYSMFLRSNGTLWIDGYGYLGESSYDSRLMPYFDSIDFSATASSSTTVDLTYDTNVQVTKFVVKRGTEVISCPQVGANLWCQDEGLTPGTPYTYTVEAYTNDNFLIDSQKRTVTPGGIQVPKLTMEADHPSVSAGSSFTTGVKIELAKDIFAEDVTITYDPTLFSFDGAETAGAGLKIYQQSETWPGMIRFVVASQGAQYGLQDTASLLNLTWKAKTTAGKGTFAISQALVANSKGEEIVPTTGSIEINVLAGGTDVNLDGRTSLGDLAIASYQFGMEKSSWLYPKADVDQNEEINDVDLSAIVDAIFASANK